MHGSPRVICALEGSTVDMFCSYMFPYHLRLQRADWLNSSSNAATDISQLPQYKDRVKVNCRDDHCSLHINSVKHSDKGDYYCRVTTNVGKETRTGKPGAKISVTGKDFAIFSLVTHILFNFFFFLSHLSGTNRSRSVHSVPNSILLGL